MGPFYRNRAYPHGGDFGSSPDFWTPGEELPDYSQPYTPHYFEEDEEDEYDPDVRDADEVLPPQAQLAAAGRRPGRMTRPGLESVIPKLREIEGRRPPPLKGWRRHVGNFLEGGAPNLLYGVFAGGRQREQADYEYAKKQAIEEYKIASEEAKRNAQIERDYSSAEASQANADRYDALRRKAETPTRRDRFYGVPGSGGYGERVEGGQDVFHPGQQQEKLMNVPAGATVIDQHGNVKFTAPAKVEPDKPHYWNVGPGDRIVMRGADGKAAVVYTDPRPPLPRAGEVARSVEDKIEAEAMKLLRDYNYDHDAAIKAAPSMDVRRVIEQDKMRIKSGAPSGKGGNLDALGKMLGLPGANGTNTAPPTNAPAAAPAKPSPSGGQTITPAPTPPQQTPQTAQPQKATPQQATPVQSKYKVDDIIWAPSEKTGQMRPHIVRKVNPDGSIDADEIGATSQPRKK